MCEEDLDGFSCGYNGLQLTLALLVITVNAIEQHLLANRPKKTSFEFFLISFSLADLMFGAAVFTQCLIEVGQKYDLLVLQRSKDLSYLQTMATAFTIFASLIHLNAIAFDRVLATRFPLLYKVWVSRKQTYICIIFIWLICLFLTPISVTHPASVHPISRCSIISLSWFTITLGAFALFLHVYAVRTIRTRINSKRQAQGYLRRAVLCTVGEREVQSVLISTLLIVSFFLCKVPLAVALILNVRSPVFQVLLSINANLNPLIYSCEIWRRNKRRKKLKFKENPLVEVANLDVPHLMM